MPGVFRHSGFDIWLKARNSTTLHASVTPSCPARAIAFDYHIRQQLGSRIPTQFLVLYEGLSPGCQLGHAAELESCEFSQVLIGTHSADMQRSAAGEYGGVR
jgi:hypothetical protein